MTLKHIMFSKEYLKKLIMFLQHHCRPISNTNSLFEKTQHNPSRMLSHRLMSDSEVHECCLQSYPSKYYISPHILKVQE